MHAHICTHARVHAYNVFDLCMWRMYVWMHISLHVHASYFFTAVLSSRCSLRLFFQSSKDWRSAYMRAGHWALFTARLAAQCPCSKAEARIANHQGQLHLPAKEKKRNRAAWFSQLANSHGAITIHCLTMSYILCVYCLPLWPFSLIICALQKSATGSPKSDAMLLSVLMNLAAQCGSKPGSCREILSQAWRPSPCLRHRSFRQRWALQSLAMVRTWTAMAKVQGGLVAPRLAARRKA